MSLIKTAADLALMQEGGQKLHDIREKLLDQIKVGAIPLEIDDLAKRLIKEAGGAPSFMTVNGYKWATCISVNDGVVHGIPTKVPLKPGDRVGLDVGFLYQGFHTDTSWSVYLDSFDEQKNRQIHKFLQVGETALKKAIQAACFGNRIGHISKAIQDTVEGAGYSVVKSLVGHGVGTTLHEAPQVPGLITKPLEKTPLLQAGMVLAIEVIYNMGKPEIVHAGSDGWTLATADGSLSGLFEQTVAVTDNGPLQLT